MAVKYVPERQCIVCRQRFPKKDLIRFVGTADGCVKIDQSGRQNGRGAYMCYKPACHEKARKNRVLERQLKQSVDLSIWQALAKELDD